MRRVQRVNGSYMLQEGVLVLGVGILIEEELSAVAYSLKYLISLAGPSTVTSV